jgi:hypothetical protein
MLFRRNNIFPILACIALLASSCGSPAQNESEIATAVALTVQAQNSLTEIAALPTLTPVPSIENTPTPEASLTNTPAAVSANPGCVVSANLVGENPPDNTLFRPGETFLKTWTLLNTGSCTWDNSYSIVFWSGDLMGGLTTYKFPELVAPNESKDISIFLKAPDTEGTFTGYWRLQTPWGENFGVGAKSDAFYVQIDVSNATKLDYGVTNLTAQLVRDPEEGCPLNVRYYVYATVTTNGPHEFSYYWDQSDGNESGSIKYKAKQAGSVTFKRDWLISKNDNPNPRWIKFVITGSDEREIKVDILHNCFTQ